MNVEVGSVVSLKGDKSRREVRMTVEGIKNRRGKVTVRTVWFSEGGILMREKFPLELLMLHVPIT